MSRRTIDRKDMTRRAAAGRAPRPLVEAVEPRRLLAGLDVELFPDADIDFGQARDAAAYDVNADGATAVATVGNDSNNLGVFVRVIGPDGEEIVGPTQVNVNETGAQFNPAVSINDDGGFTVVWQDAALDGSGDGIFYRVFDADGTSEGNDLQINASSTGDQVRPTITNNPVGDRFVTYYDLNTTGNLRGRTISAEGEIGTEVVLKPGDGQESYPAVGVADDGDAYVAFAAGNAGTLVLADQNGTRPPIDLGATAREPRVAVLPGGNAAVVYENDDGDGFGIAFQIYDDEGNQVVAETQINGSTAGVQIRPRVAGDGLGNVLVTYNSDRGPGANPLLAAVIQADGTVPLTDSPLGIDRLTPPIVAETVTKSFAVGRGRFAYALEDVGDGDGFNGYAVFFDANDVGTPGDDGVTAVPAEGGGVTISDGDTTIDVPPDAGRYIRVELGDGEDRFNGPSVAADFALGLGAGNDVARTGPGDDTIAGGGGDDSIRSEAGDDVVGSGSGDDTVISGAGDDEVSSADGNDSVDGGDGRDLLNGGAGDDVLLGGAGRDALRGEDGLDYLFGDVGRDTLFGGADYDILTGADGRDVLYGEGGDDRLNGGTGDDFLDGGDGDDRIFGDGGFDLLIGRDGNDILRGGDEDDTLHGLAGNDVLIGEVGNDLLIGESGDDTLNGGSGRDRLYGQAGNDFLGGGPGDDLMDGGDDEDTGFLRDSDATDNLETLLDR